MPATTAEANENLFSYMSTLSLSLWDPGRKKKNGERERERSSCENKRDTHTHGGGEIKDLGKSLCLFQV